MQECGLCLLFHACRKLPQESLDVLGFPCGRSWADFDGLGIPSVFASGPPCAPADGNQVQHLRQAQQGGIVKIIHIVTPIMCNVKDIHKYCVCAYDSVLEAMIRFLANQIVPIGIPVSPEISAVDFCQSMLLQSILRRSLGTSGGNSLCPNAFLRSFIRTRLRSVHSGEQQPYP